MTERFDIDVGYHDPDDRRDDFPEDKPSPAEYGRACELLAVGIAECCDYWAIGLSPPPCSVCQ